MTTPEREMLRYTKAGAFDDDAPAYDFVRGKFYDNSLAFIYGPPGSAKTFLALHYGCSIALGRAVFGLPTDRRRCLYIGLEGDAGIKSRIAAWCAQNGVEENPIFYARGPLNLGDTTGAEVSAVMEFSNKHEIGVIIIDTYAMATPGLDEVSAAHMTFALAALHRLRTETGVCVLVIHHTGKDQSKGLRGHSSLLGNSDTVIELTVCAKDTTGETPITNDTPRCATVRKQRDGRTGQRFYFKLAERETPFRNARGETVTSLAVDEHESFPDLPPEESAALPSGIDVLALETLEALKRRNRRLEVELTRKGFSAALKREGWKQSSKTPDAWKRAFRRLMERLEETGLWEATVQ
jgi:hypothetical protein